MGRGRASSRSAAWTSKSYARPLWAAVTSPQEKVKVSLGSHMVFVGAKEGQATRQTQHIDPTRQFKVHPRQQALTLL